MYPLDSDGQPTQVPVSRSAKLYQERRLPKGRTTRRLPTPRSNLSRNQVHQLPLDPPFPTPAVLQHEGGQPPDASLTTPWPHGEAEITV